MLRGLDEPPSEILIRISFARAKGASPGRGPTTSAYPSRPRSRSSPLPSAGQSFVSPPIDSTVSFTFTQLAGRFGLITLIVIIVLVWTLIRVVRFVTQLWRNTNATGSAQIGVAAAA
jgi:hypothetical protein